MRKASLLLAMGLMVLVSSYGVWAQHDNNCVECHSIHEAQGPKLLAVKPDTKSINPRTKKPMSGISSLCMGCHIGDGGPEIAIMKTHPVGIIPNPKIAQVPKEWLREGGKFECSSCHDFHPANPNYKYLRVDTKDGNELGKFCAVCHSDKREKKAKAKKKK